MSESRVECPINGCDYALEGDKESVLVGMKAHVASHPETSRKHLIRIEKDLDLHEKLKKKRERDSE